MFALGWFMLFDRKLDYTEEYFEKKFRINLNGRTNKLYFVQDTITLKQLSIIAGI